MSLIAALEFGSSGILEWTRYKSAPKHRQPLVHALAGL